MLSSFHTKWAGITIIGLQLDASDFKIHQKYIDYTLAEDAHFPRIARFNLKKDTFISV